MFLKFTRGARIFLALIMAIFAQSALPSALAYASNGQNGNNNNPPGNNGTLQVHEKGSTDYKRGNEPHVCTFNFEAFGLDANQTGDIHITNQAPTQPKDEEVLTIALETDGDGDGNTIYVNDPDQTASVSLPDGHYKATLDNKFGTDKNGKAKSKVFWVECGAPIYTHDQFNLTSMCKPSSDKGQFRIRNQSNTEQAYTLTQVAGGNQVFTGIVAANTDDFVTVAWGSSSDTWQLDIGGQTYTKAIGDNELCQTPVPEQPTVTVTINQCIPNSGTTDIVDVRVYNAADQTNQTVNYTVSLAGQTKGLTIDDGKNANTQFSGVPAGAYTATVTGDDGTSVITNQFTVEACPFQPATPTVEASIVTCEQFPSLTSDKVSVRVFNTADQTHASVTYTIVMNGKTKTVTVPDGENRNVEFANLTAGNYSAVVTGDDGTGPITTNEVQVRQCQQLPQPTPADITASAVCTEVLKAVTVTLTNAGDLDGQALVNGQTYDVAAHSSRQVTVAVDITALSTPVKVSFNGNLIYDEDITCLPGQGGGPIVPPVTKPPVKQPVVKHVDKVQTELPTELPATGSSVSPLLAVLAGVIAYGAVYLMQSRRQYNPVK